MVLKKRITFVILLLGGIIIMGLTSLTACGLNKDSREWIEQNRVSDIYKVYPTKNPKDLFKVFPDGFGIRQSYTGKDGVTYELNVEGDPNTKEIKGDLVRDPIDDAQKVSDVRVEDSHLVFSDPSVKQYWPTDEFLFQHLAINQAYLDKLKSTDHGYNSQSGSFNIAYQLSDSAINKFLNLKDEEIEKFEISGWGKEYRQRTIKLNFTQRVEFFEGINKIIE
ncbi:lipoprotein [Streptococcus criceti]|uniref:Lipoprotein n=1 Tax=Streptococcus criceti HS-6 TaxID=873449 RepID=G5JMT9_STRCG|nr:hypothetical protein [Streptococcus criceti]EHI74049.1 hypothetical protein STRCR_0054 [Streptococcus criceti HS-6]SUN41569.1 lipoprotein [Streptococcus criceti]